PGGRRIIPEGKTYQRTEDQPEVRTLSVSPGFFKVFDLAVKQGREFSSADSREAPKVAIVSQKFVETHFAGVDPIGRRFRYGGGADSLEWRTIVGVVPNVYSGNNEKPWAETVLTPFAQDPSNFASMSVRTGGATPLR